MELGVQLHTLFDDVTKGEYLIDATSAPATNGFVLLLTFH